VRIQPDAIFIKINIRLSGKSSFILTKRREKTNMLAFLFVVATASMAFSVANAASSNSYKFLFEQENISHVVLFTIDCSLCKLGEQFTESNGYGCFPLSNGNVACTCPDQRYTLDKPCRMILHLFI
jgi:hypothetical protein